MPPGTRGEGDPCRYLRRSITRARPASTRRIALLERLGPEARLVAGGHSLLPMMKLRLATPEHLIDINPLEAELGYIREDDGEIRIGALTRHREILESELLARHFADRPRRRGADRRPARAQPRHDRRRALPGRPVRGPQRGVRRARRRRRHPRPRRRARRRHGRLPPRARTRRRSATPRCWSRCGSRCASTAAARTRRSSGARATGRPRRPAPRCGSTAPTSPPPGSRSAPSTPRASARRGPRQALVGRAPSEEAFAEAAALAAEDCEPIGDLRGPAEYKRHLARELTHRALRRAAERALAS